MLQLKKDKLEKRIAIRLTEKQHDRVIKEARKHKVTVCEFIRELIRRAV